MKNIFIEYPKCSTCKKAKKWLEENHVDFIERNIVTRNTNTRRTNQMDRKKWTRYKEMV